MLVALDTCEAPFGVWQAAGQIGAEIYDEPGSLVWTDARLTDPEAGRRFYGAVFGYTFQPTPGGPDDYATFLVDGDIAGGLGGMMGSPPGVPPHWLPYFSVADVDTAVAAAEHGGGAVITRPEDTPFGRISVLIDPFAATFALHGPHAGDRQGG